jgi:raffinose/stachyose/melibiose transport system substrate-binding protein
MAMPDTTLSRRKVLQVGAAAAGLTLLPGTRRAAAQDVTLRFWNTRFPLTDPNDKTKKPEDFYISKAIARFEAATPGIEVEMEAVPDNNDMFVKYRTASVAKQGPDVMGMWSGSYMLGLKDFLEPLNAYFSTDERKRITGWAATSADFKEDSDQIYGVPAGSDGTTCIFYNKDMFDKAGVDPAGSWRASFDDFQKMLEAIKATGVTPLVLENNAIDWQVLAWWQAQMMGGSDQVAKLVTGETNFSNPTLTDIVTHWQLLKDYTIPGAETMQGPDSRQLFYQKQAAMTTAGFWIISEGRDALGDSLGMIKMPNYSPEAPIKDGGIGGAGIAYIVSNYSQHKDEAVAFIKYLMSKEEQALNAQSGEGSLLNVTDVDTSKYYTDPFKQTQQEWANEPSTIFWLDNLYPADLTNEILAQSQLAWTGQISAADFLAKIDAKRNELLGS